ncbi:MAG: nucleotidyltransferase substrate binding protein [Gemmatimonadota bacterium]
MNQDIRWQQRFENLCRALFLLDEAISFGVDRLSPLEKEGTVQRFEYTLELSWKTLKDYLEQQGFSSIPSTPRQVIKDAYAAGILPDGQVWIDMIDHRNLLSHTYDALRFAEAVSEIGSRYLPAMKNLRQWFEDRR